MNIRFTLGSTLCFTTMTTLHGTGKLTDSPLVIVAQSSALSLSLPLPPSKRPLSAKAPQHAGLMRQTGFLSPVTLGRVRGRPHA